MKYKRLDIEVDYIRLCPYCKKRKIKRATCGDRECQYKHHITSMRLKRKTDRKCMKRRVPDI